MPGGLAAAAPLRRTGGPSSIATRRLGGPCRRRSADRGGRPPRATVAGAAGRAARRAPRARR
eukprot:12157273-Alexandrium_andersonii.AAC.1